MQRSLFPVLILASLFVTTARASDGLDVSLFHPANPSTLQVSSAQRAGAAFLEMDRSKFAALASWRDFLCVIPDFPLGQDGLHDLRVEQFDAVASDIKGRFAVPAHVFFRGSVDGIPQSHVCLTIYEDCAWGYVNAGDKTYTIAAAGRTETGNLILGIAPDTVSVSDFNCGVKDWSINSLPPHAPTSSGSSGSPFVIPLATSVTQLTVGLEMDYLSVQRCGGTDTAAFKYGLAILAAADDIYMRDAAIALVCSSHFEWTTPDNYPDSAACWILNQFDGSNLPSTGASMRVLFSGRSTDWCGGLAAGIGVLCSATDAKCVCGIKNSFKANAWNFPYSTWIWDAMVSTHEMGHLVACPHTHNCWWDPPLDSCVQAEGGYCYPTPVPSKGTIMSYCHTTPAGAVLKFHPRCSDLMDQQLQQYACKTTQAVPVISVSPTRHVQTCAPTVTFTASVANGTPPLLFEFSAAPASSTINGNSCTFTVKSNKQVFYLRVTDANSIRTYDSVIISSGNYAVHVSQDSTSLGPDTVRLTATATDTVGARCSWFLVPNPLGRTIGSGWQITLPRDTIPAKYGAKATSGACIAYDTATVGAKPLSRGVAGRAFVPFRMFPNPARDRITAIVPADGSRLWIEDVLGRRMDVSASRSTFSTDIEDAEQIDLDISALPAGSYWLVRDAGTRSAGTINVLSFQKW